MEAYQMRVIEERNELAEKLGRLTEFLATKMFDDLEDADAILLSVQRKEMAAYLDTLDCRIKRFT